MTGHLLPELILPMTYLIFSMAMSTSLSPMFLCKTNRTSESFICEIRTPVDRILFWLLSCSAASTWNGRDGVRADNNCIFSFSKLVLRVRIDMVRYAMIRSSHNTRFWKIITFFFFFFDFEKFIQTFECFGGMIFFIPLALPLIKYRLLVFEK